MKKFSGISRIFLILSSFGFLFIFNSCSDLLSNSSGTVSVSLGSEVFQRALSEDQLQDLGFTSYRLEVSIKGDYEARQERIWTSTELLETAGNNEGLFTDITVNSTNVQIAEILAKKLSEGASFNFEGIPVGKTVRIEGKFYQTISRGEESYTELLFHGSSAEKQIEYGTNELPISIFRAYAEFPLEITLNFPAGTDVDSFVDSLLLVMAVSDSDKVKSLSELLAAGDKFAIYNAIRAFQFSSSLYDYPRISCVENYEITGTSVKITDTVSLPVSITDKNRGEELAMVPIIYSLTLGGKYFVSGSIPKITPVKGQTTSTSFDVQKLGIIDTDMMLYNVQYDEYNSVDGYKYYLTDNAGQTITSDTPATVTTSSSKNSFCFDGDGYYYVIAGKEEDATYIKSNKPDFGSKTLGNTIVPDSMHLYGDLGGLLTVDRLTNKLYMFAGSNSEISQITKDDGEYAYDGTNYISAKTFSFSEDSNREKINWESVFTVYNGVAYFASVSEGVNLVIADLENAVAGGTEDYYNITGSKLVSLELGEMNLSSDATITDMLYQDGAVYMLLRDFNPDGLQGSSVVNQTYYSRGAVIKYDVFSGLVSNCGWTNEALSDAGKKLYGYYNTSQDIHYFTANDSANNWKTESAWYAIEMDKIKTYMTPIFNFALYVPSAADTNAFYGPQKFIAVKPKKLIISDEGVAFYTDANGAFRVKNVNRIVTVDLEKFAIADSTEASATFGAEESSGIFPGTVYWNTNQLESGETIYISNGSSWSNVQERNVFVGIPLSE